MKWATLLLVALVGIGCRPRAPSIHHYLLQTQVEAVAATRPASIAAKPTLVVEDLDVDASYDDDRMVYRESEYRLERYHYHRWAAPPGLLVSDALREGYAATGLFESVERGWEADADAVLRGRVIALEEVDLSATRWVGHVAIELELVDARTERTLWSERLDRTEPLGQRSPAGLAAAVSAILGDIVRSSAPAIHDVGLPSTERRGSG